MTLSFRLAVACGLLALPSVAATTAPTTSPTTMPSTAPAAYATLAQPSLSPDGREVAFVAAGGIWTVPTAGGDAHPLISGMGDVLRPRYSPDGTRLAFVSNHTGNGDLYVLTLDTGDLKRVTVDEAPDRLDDWSPDGTTLYYSTGGHEVGATSDVYKVRVDGGTPMPVVAEPFGGDAYAAPSPDGKTLAFCNAGMAASQWWRHGHAHIDCCAVWTTADGKRFDRRTDDASKHLWPMWSPDGHALYFMSDADGNENLYAAPIGRPTTGPAVALPLTHFHDGRALWPSIGRDGRAIVFERDFGIWKLDLSTGRVGPIPIRLRGVVAAAAAVQHQTFTRDASELAVSHDGRKVAVVVRGQVFAGPAVPGDPPQPAVRVTRTDAIESAVTWSADDRRLAYVSTRDGYRHVYAYDFATRRELRLTDADANDAAPAFAPDDSAVAFVRNGTELRAIDLKLKRTPTTGPATRPTTATATTRRRRQSLRDVRAAVEAALKSRDRLLTAGLHLEQPPFGGRRTVAWSPAGDYLCVVSGGDKGFHNAYLVPAAGGPPRQVTFLANTEDSPPAWTPDGTAILFATGQRTEESDLVRVDLKPRTPTFRTDQFSDLFRQRPTRPTPEPANPRRPSGDDEAGAGPATTTASTTASPPPPTTAPTTRPDRTEVVFDDIDQRLALLPVGVDVDSVAVSPDGKWAGVVGSAAGKTNLYLYPLDPFVDQPVARQLTATPGGKSDLQFAPDPGGFGTRLYYREGGRVRFVPVPARTTSSAAAAPAEPVDVAVPVEMDVDFDRDKRVAFEQGWRYLADQFHDPAMHGLDWAAVRDRFAPHLAAARTPADQRRVMSLMIGELNASHSGVSAPAEDRSADVARLGVTWDAAEYDRTGRLKIAAVVPFGPAALAGLTPGQRVVAIDGHPTDRPANADALLEDKAGKEVTLAVADAAAGFLGFAGVDAHRDVKVMTVSPATERTLAYRAWVHANRAYVAKASGGRLGYVHMADMGKQALDRLSLDLDARNETVAGVVVDVRNNNGGFVNGYALDVFVRRNYITLQGRDSAKSPGRSALGQRYLGLPTVLVTNRDTLSDGEDFTEGYQALGLGDTVGEPTAGWIIFTSGASLLDGTGLRLPSESVYDHAGVEMEMHPRPVTTFAQHPVGEATAGRDAQLDAAVKDLLGKVGMK